MDTIFILMTLSVAIFVNLVLLYIVARHQRTAKTAQDGFREDLYAHISTENRYLREEIEGKIDRFRANQLQMFELGRDATTTCAANISKDMQDGMHSFFSHTSVLLENVRQTVDERLREMRISSEESQAQMRHVVSEKLEKTLENRLQKSFDSVSAQLESVNKGLGEMKAVAQSVGSLNRILSNVKSRGTLGEVQLGQIIEDMLPPQLYMREAATNPESTRRVDYAIKLPGAGHSEVLLPVDSKFPLDAYERLLNAYDAGLQPEIAESRKQLFGALRNFARDIVQKYICPPQTTNFAIMFLPTEGLYAEIAREGAFFEELRRTGITIAGPTTFAAMLNSLQMGFKTLQIQRGTADIEKTLGAVKREFGKFEDVLKKAHQRIMTAGAEIDNLVGTRTNAINRSLRNVEVYLGDDTLSLVDNDMYSGRQ